MDKFWRNTFVKNKLREQNNVQKAIIIITLLCILCFMLFLPWKAERINKGIREQVPVGYCFILSDPTPKFTKSDAIKQNKEDRKFSAQEGIPYDKSSELNPDDYPPDWVKTHLSIDYRRYIGGIFIPLVLGAAIYLIYTWSVMSKKPKDDMDYFLSVIETISYRVSNFEKYHRKLKKGGDLYLSVNSISEIAYFFGLLTLQDSQIIKELKEECIERVLANNHAQTDNIDFLLNYSLNINDVFDESLTPMDRNRLLNVYDSLFYGNRVWLIYLFSNCFIGKLLDKRPLPENPYDEQFLQ